MELDLDVKDVIILSFFDDFRQSGRMNYEIIDEVGLQMHLTSDVSMEILFVQQ